MEKRKRNLINKNFQLGLSFSILSVIIVFTLGIISFITIYSIKNQQSNTASVNQLIKVIKSEDNIVKTYVDYSKKMRNKDLLLISEKTEKDHKRSIKMIVQHMKKLNSGVKKNFYLLMSVIVLSIVQILILFIYLIKRTNNIAGPIYIINQQLDNILQGKDPGFRELRENDDFKELYEKLKQVYWKMK